MAGDLTIVLVPGRVERETLLEAAKEAFGEASRLDLAALIVLDEACDDALRERTGPFSAISFWTQGTDEIAIEAYIPALSKRLGGRKLLVCWATEFGGGSGWRVFQDGKVGRAEVFKDAGVTVVKANGVEALLGKPVEGLDVHKLAFGGSGVRLLPSDEQGEEISKEEAERVLYDADPLLFSGQGELKSVRRPRPKRRIRRMNTAVTELPEDWRGWAKGQLRSAASLPRVVQFLTERGVEENVAQAHAWSVLRTKRDTLSASGKSLLVAGIGIVLAGAGWLLAPLTQRRGRIEDPLPQTGVMIVGLVMAGVGFKQRMESRAADPDGTDGPAKTSAPGS